MRFARTFVDISLTSLEMHASYESLIRMSALEIASIFNFARNEKYTFDREDADTEDVAKILADLFLPLHP